MTPTGCWRSASVPLPSLCRSSPFHADAFGNRDTPSASLQEILPPRRRQQIQAPKRALYTCSAIHLRHSGAAPASGGCYSKEDDKKISVFCGRANCLQLDGAAAPALSPTPSESVWQVRRDWKWRIPESGSDPHRRSVLSLVTLSIRMRAGSGPSKGLVVPCSDLFSGTAGQGRHYPRAAGVREFGFLCTKKVDKHLKLRVHPNNMGPSDISNLVRVVAAKQINDGEDKDRVATIPILAALRIKDSQTQELSVRSRGGSDMQRSVPTDRTWRSLRWVHFLTSEA